MAWRDLKRILCVRLDSMGDVLLSEPAMRALKESNPQARISLLTSKSGMEAAKLCSVVDEVITYDPPWSSAGLYQSSVDRAFIAGLQARNFDASVIFTSHSQSPLPAALFCYLAQIPKRLAHCRENPHQLLTNWVMECEPHLTVRHEVRRQLDLVATVGCYTSDERIRVPVPSFALTSVEHALEAQNFGSESPFAVFNLDRSMFEKSDVASPEKIAFVANALFELYGMGVVFTGSKISSELYDSLNRYEKEIPIATAGDLGLTRTAALLSKARLFISGPSDLIHVASAMRAPTLHVYNFEAPERIPWQVPSRLLFQDPSCSDCEPGACSRGKTVCLRRAEPSWIVEAADSLLTDLGWNSIQERKLTFERTIPKAIPVNLPKGVPALSKKFLARLSSQARYH